MTSSILAALLLFAPITLERGRFNILQDGKKIGVEEFSIAARGAGYLVEGKTQMNGDPAALTSRMELDDKLNPISYEYTKGAASIRVKIERPASEFTTIADGKESSINFRLPDDAFIIDNNFFHHYLLLLYKVGAAGATLPIFVPQDMRMGQATIRSKGNLTYELEMGDVKLQATTDANGRLIRLAVPEAKVVVER